MLLRITLFSRVIPEGADHVALPASGPHYTALVINWQQLLQTDLVLARGLAALLCPQEISLQVRLEAVHQVCFPALRPMGHLKTSTR